MFQCLLLLLSALSLVHAQNTGSSQTFYPAAVPLAVRSPYFSAWLPTLNTSLPVSNTWPSFWALNNPSPVLGWAGHIRIDSQTYKWLGNANEPFNVSNLTSTQVTPTRTVFSLQAGPMDLTVTFLSPIEPSDLVRQSMPFSYVALDATSNDGKPHNVQVYSDISGEWLSANRTQVMTWNTTHGANAIYHTLSLQSPSPMTEDSGQAEDGTAVYAMSTSLNPTFQVNEDTTCRGQFAQSGSLTNEGEGSNVHDISTPWFPVFALSADLGTINSTSSPVVWAIGFVRDPSIEYTNSTGETELRSPYYRTQYDGIDEVIEAFLSDFSNAQTRSVTLDEKILQDASAISADYGDLVSLAARQTFGGIDITVSNGTDGQWNTTDVKIFMKDIGTSGRISPVEVLYAAFPTFLYLNASYGKPLLSPLLEFQDSPRYTLSYAAQDLGTSYPVAQGDTSPNQQGVEQSGNMLIMALAHARATGDGSLLGEHYGLFKQWGNYLVNNSKTPINQISADDQEAANMTNLAIKGIIAIQAMSEISRAVGENADAQNFANNAAAYAATWQSLAESASQNHLLFSYGEANSWALMYNLYADLLLGTRLVSETVYDQQAAYYEALSQSNPYTFGLPIDSDAATKGNSAWLLFTAATCQNTSVRDSLVAMAWKHAAFNQTAAVFPTTYLVDTGAGTRGMASPGQGAVFAPLALNIANVTIVVPQATGSSSTTKHTINVGAIVGGGVVGGICGLALVALVAFLYRRRAQRLKLGGFEGENVVIYDPTQEPLVHQVTPFAPASRPLPSLPVDSPTVYSSKAREHLEAGLMAGPSPASSYTSTSQAPSSREPPTTFGSDTQPATVSSPIVSPSDVRDLRAEVEILRRVMQDIHAERLEPPPGYVG
ncbi:Glutaminase A [Sparassis crispa]|uniref:Glutaminase A n=1 Tax=Sparassis crispa TaxID=139825 RepID=A0A401GG61_9APHY|nr:Glutaminase A [Sparassis crispa]GBE81170.1 Glutaminase A [Sparassis crispa]